jgi:hypothetical protein
MSATAVSVITVCDTGVSLGFWLSSHSAEAEKRQDQHDHNDEADQIDDAVHLLPSMPSGSFARK